MGDQNTLPASSLNPSRRGIVAIFALAWLATGLSSAHSAPAGDSQQQIHRIKQIILSQGGDPSVLAHLVQLTSDLEAPAAAQLFYQLGEEYLRTGNLNLAGEILQQLVKQYPEQPLATQGLITLVQLYSSGEVAYVKQPGNQQTLSEDRQMLARYALDLADRAIQRNRELANHSALIFQCAVASRIRGNSKSAQSWLTPLKHNARLKPWYARAQSEVWLFETRENKSPLPTTPCTSARSKPHLDGKLDELIWQASPPQQIVSAAAGTTQIRFARDEQFLYLAVECKKLAGEDYPVSTTPRTYDADLSQQDRVRVLLDVDRDYATFFQLTVDHRGWTADACWYDTTWNPRWFVASHSDATSWTAEVAIPWAELTITPPHLPDAWVIALDRILPGTEATPLAPKDFSLLLFD